MNEETVGLIVWIYRRILRRSFLRHTLSCGTELYTTRCWQLPDWPDFEVMKVNIHFSETVMLRWIVSMLVGRFLKRSLASCATNRGCIGRKRPSIIRVLGDRLTSGPIPCIAVLRYNTCRSGVIHDLCLSYGSLLMNAAQFVANIAMMLTQSGYHYSGANFNFKISTYEALERHHTRETP